MGMRPISQAFQRAICHPTPPETLGVFQVGSSQRLLDIIGTLSLMSISQTGLGDYLSESEFTEF